MHQALWLRLWAPFKRFQPRDRSARFYPKMVALSLCIAGLAACGDGDNHAVAANEPTREAAISDAGATALSKVALTTLPQLPVNILQHDSLYSGTTNHNADVARSDNPDRADLSANTDTGLAGSQGWGNVLNTDNTAGLNQRGDTDGIKVISWETPSDIAIQNCAAGGIVNIKREPKRLSDGDTNATIETAVTLDFIDCTSQQGDATLAQNGILAINTSIEANKLSHGASADVLAEFNDYSHKEFGGEASNTVWVDGEFGITTLQHGSKQGNSDPAATTTMLAASGTIDNPYGNPTTRITFRDFGVVFERSQHQQLLYMMGDVDADIDDESFRYTLSTIEPMGIANGVIQGRFLVETGMSKIFIDRISADEVTVSVDRDGDGAIDYANNLENSMMTAFSELFVTP